MTQTIYHAEVETRSFTFRGYGTTADQARAAITAAWTAHVELTDADPDYLQPDDINVYACALGQGYRDETALGTPVADTAATARAYLRARRRSYQP